MNEYEEGMLVVAVYVFVITVFTLPFLAGYLFYKVSRIVTRARKVLDFMYENEIKERKYRE